MTEISSVLASDYAMTRSSARPSRKLSPSPWCPCCLARRRARDLIDSSRFDAAVELLEAEVKGAGVDVNGNLRRDSSEGAEGSATCEACAAIVPTTNLAEKWSLLSMARLERSVVGENDLFRAWEEVPKRHKKKFSTFVELFKSLKKIPADLKAFHVSFSSYERGIKGAVEAAEKALRLESTFFEAHFHMARAIYKLENLSATEEKKTISAAQHIAKYLRLQFGDESAPPGFNPKLWLFLKELNHSLYQSVINDSPAFDYIRHFEDVFLVGGEGPACFADLKAASKYVTHNEIKNVTLLVAPGKYEASLEDVPEFPDGTKLDIVGNVTLKLGLRWRQVLRHLSDHVVISLPTDEASSPFSCSGNVVVSFSRIAFITSGSNSAPIVGASDGAEIEIDGCSFHSVHDYEADVSPQETVAVSSTSEGVVAISNSLFFQIAHGVVAEDGGKVSLSSSSFFDISGCGLSASSQAAVEVDACDFVNSEVFIHGNAEARVNKSSFKRQHPAQGATLSGYPERDLIKIKKGASASIEGSRFVSARLSVDEAAPMDLCSAAVNAGGFGTRVVLLDNSFSHVEKCVVLTEKAKGEMKKNKFLDCGRMISITGHAKAVLEENNPCMGMIPLMLDDDTELPDMLGPNTYRAERLSNSPQSPGAFNGALATAAQDSGSTPKILGRQFCHHCLKDDVAKGNKATSLKPLEMVDSNADSAYSSLAPRDSSAKKKKKKKPKSDASPLGLVAAPRRSADFGQYSPKESSSSTSLSTPSPRAYSETPPRNASPTAFLFCACGSTYCSRDCQLEDWKDHQLVCGIKRRSKGRKLSINFN